MMTRRLFWEYSEAAGCSSKLAPTKTKAILDAAGIKTPVAYYSSDRDDAAAIPEADGSWTILTVDNSPLTGDTPHTCGRIAALNAMSDVWAMGGEPRYLAGTVVATAGLAQADLVAVLKGASEAAEENGAAYVTGQMNRQAGSDTPWLGFAVVGKVCAGETLMLKRNLRPGQSIVLTKPLGTGIILTAAGQGVDIEVGFDAAMQLMSAGNGQAAKLLRHFKVDACTDVSGNGLAGSLAEMIALSGVSVRLHLDAVPMLPGVATALRALPLIPVLNLNNREWCEELVQLKGSVWTDSIAAVLFDSQTSGGLLATVNNDDLERLLALFRSNGHDVFVIGDVVAGGREIVLV